MPNIDNNDLAMKLSFINDILNDLLIDRFDLPLEINEKLQAASDLIFEAEAIAADD